MNQASQGQTSTVPVHTPSVVEHIVPTLHAPHAPVTSASSSHCQGRAEPQVSTVTPPQRSCPIAPRSQQSDALSVKASGPASRFSPPSISRGPLDSPHPVIAEASIQRNPLLPMIQLTAHVNLPQKEAYRG